MRYTLYKFLAVGVSLILVGCGDQSSVPEGFGEITTFTIDTTSWEVAVPENWERVPTTNYPEAVYIAREGDVNFIILYRRDYSEGVIDDMMAGAKQDFFALELLSQTDDRWSFVGKPEATLPERQFVQALGRVEGSEDFLLGTCSYPTNQDRASLCDSIFDTWKVVKEENK